MPSILNPNVGSTLEQIKENGKNIVTMATAEPLDYTYPGGLDLKPSGAGLHQEIKDDILFKAMGSRRALQDRFDGWRKIDKTLTTYIVKDDKEQKTKNADDRKPVRVVVPITYAVLETLLTYNSAAFLEEPYFRYDGFGPEDVLGAKLMEMAVAQQCRRAKVGLDMHTTWRDGFGYGIGPAHIGWKDVQGYRTTEQSKSVFSRLLNKFVDSKNGDTETVRNLVNIYSGSTLTAIDPYTYLPDPTTPIEKVQDGEFVGWVERTNLMSLLMLEEDNPKEYFNVKYLKALADTGRSILMNRDDSGRNEKYGNQDNHSGVNRPIDIIHMYVRVIPESKGLSKNSRPEIWLFSLAADQVVIRAQPLNLDHNMFPVTVNAPDYDGHSTTPISRLETIYGLQETIDWQFDSHIANIRKAINDMLIVDPQLINIHDLANPKPGKLIRMRRSAWGRGVKDAVMQLQVNDITRQNIPDTQYVQDIIRSVSGAQDVVSGIRRRTSERVSATEARDTMAGALSRLEKSAKITSMQAHYDIAYQMAWNTRQLLRDDIYVKMVGDWERVLSEDLNIKQKKGRLAIRPGDLNIDFDIVPHDGTVPSSGNPDVMMRVFEIIAQNPQLEQRIDIVRLFKNIARISGAKNINDFVINGGQVQPQLTPDEDVQEGVERGELEAIPNI